MERKTLNRRLLVTTIGSITAVVILVTVVVGVVAYLRVRHNMFALAYQDSTNVVERLRTCALMSYEHTEGDEHNHNHKHEHADEHEADEPLTPLEHLSLHLASMAELGPNYLDVCDRESHVVLYAPQERQERVIATACLPLWPPNSDEPLTTEEILRRNLVTAGKMRPPGREPEVVSAAAIPQLGWVIRYHQPETSVQKLVESATLPILWILALVILTVPLQAFLFIRTIVKPYALRPLEQKVAAERAEADALLDATVDGVVVIGADYKVLRANRAAVDMHGDIVGRHCREALSCAADSGELCLSQQVFESGRAARTVRQIRRREPKTGREETRWEETVATPLYGNEKEIVAAIEVIRDITERKRAEDRLAQSARLRALGELAAGIAHEIRTPMNGVTVFLEDVEEKARKIGAPAEMLRDLELIREQSDRVVGITERILSFGAAASPRMEFVQVEKVIERLLDFVGAAVRAQGIRLHRRYERDLPPVYCHCDELYEVLLNLVVNAQDAMPTGGDLRLDVSCKDDHVVVRVEDTGCGISPMDLPRVFEPGFSTKTDQGVAKGLGLGLFLAQGIVESFGGTITVQSTLGEGAVFTLSLPAAAVPDAE